MRSFSVFTLKNITQPTIVPSFSSGWSTFYVELLEKLPSANNQRPLVASQLCEVNKSHHRLLLQTTIQSLIRTLIVSQKDPCQRGKCSDLMIFPCRGLDGLIYTKVRLTQMSDIKLPYLKSLISDKAKKSSL